MTTTAGRVGRPRDPGRDDVILEATLRVLAEQGYDRTTIDLVAARAGAARATVYRRWPTKAGLVLAAVSRLSQDDVGLDALPDTGTLRGDLVAMVRPLDEPQMQVHLAAVVGLLAVAAVEPRLAAAATDAGLGPWIRAHRLLIQRAVDRGEFPPPADLQTLAEVVPMLCLARGAQRQPLDRAFSLALIDGVVLPALRGG